MATHARRMQLLPFRQTSADTPVNAPPAFVCALYVSERAKAERSFYLPHASRQIPKCYTTALAIYELSVFELCSISCFVGPTQILDRWLISNRESDARLFGFEITREKCVRPSVRRGWWKTCVRLNRGAGIYYYSPCLSLSNANMCEQRADAFVILRWNEWVNSNPLGLYGHVDIFYADSTRRTTFHLTFWYVVWIKVINNSKIN